MAGALILLIIVVAAVTAPYLTPFSPLAQDVDAILAPPSSSHWLGTDEFGRDILTRILHGSRVSLFVGMVSVIIGFSIGVPSGLVAGYYGGWLDSVIMRWWDLFLAFPGILLAIAVLAVVGTGTFQLAFVLAVGQMPLFARLTRSIVLTERELDYVKAERVLGASDARIMFSHVFPNALPSLLVQLSLAMAGAVLLEAGLSFLGLGTQPPTPTWGSMLDSSRAFLRDAPWYGVYPGLAIALLVFGLTYVADALMVIIDPRRSGRVG